MIFFLFSFDEKESKKVHMGVEMGEEEYEQKCHVSSWIFTFLFYFALYWFDCFIFFDFSFTFLVYQL